MAFSSVLVFMFCQCGQKVESLISVQERVFLNGLLAYAFFMGNQFEILFGTSCLGK